jgi:hypothetical protein
VNFYSQIQSVISFEIVYIAFVSYKEKGKTTYVRRRERQTKVSFYVVKNEEKKT